MRLCPIKEPALVWDVIITFLLTLLSTFLRYDFRCTLERNGIFHAPEGRNSLTIASILSLEEQKQSDSLLDLKIVLVLSSEE